MTVKELDNILSGSENALTDRQTAADAGRENSQGKESVKACGRYEQGTAYIKAIYTEALEEGIRCAMCTNTIKSDTGCDGGCIVDTKMYNKVMTEINSRLLRRPPKKGHWVKEESIFGWDRHSYQCSECGRSIHLDPEMEDLEDYPYCHCGAKMQEVEE